MKLSSAVLIVVVLLSSCNARKTFYINNKTSNTISLPVDNSYRATQAIAFTDSLDGLRIAHKKAFDCGEGKWTKDDKSNLVDVLKHTKISRIAAIQLPICHPGPRCRIYVLTVKNFG